MSNPTEDKNLIPLNTVANPQNISTDDSLALFAKFMRLDVAFGQASGKTIANYHCQVKKYIEWCDVNGINPIHALVLIILILILNQNWKPCKRGNYQAVQTSFIHKPLLYSTGLEISRPRF